MCFSVGQTEGIHIHPRLIGCQRSYCLYSLLLCEQPRTERFAVFRQYLLEWIVLLFPLTEDGKLIEWRKIEILDEGCQSSLWPFSCPYLRFVLVNGIEGLRIGCLSDEIIDVLV